jgi:hypothetical protein
MIIPKRINPIHVTILTIARTNSTAAGILSPSTDELIEAKEGLTLSVASNSKNLDDNYDDQEDAYKNGGAQGRIPVLDC